MFKILLISFFAAFAAGNDPWNECIKQAIARGIPEIGLPPHDPLHIPRDINIQRELFGYNFTLSMTDLTWYNIPLWNVTKYEKVYEDDEIESYQFHIYWSYFNITSDYELSLVQEPVINFDHKGDIIFDFESVDWIGEYNITKSVDGSQQTLTELEIKWETQEIKVDVTNSGAIEEIIDMGLEEALSLLLDLASNENLIGQAFQYQINNQWLNNSTRLELLQEWCTENGITTVVV